MNRRTPAHFTGCLLGGAVGDALGAPVEFTHLNEIRDRFGPEGVTGYVGNHSGAAAEFTDDTQMTLFTAEGLLSARERGRERGIWSPTASVHHAYLGWLRTQQEPFGSLSHASGLLKLPQMWKVKAPGNTCLSALRANRPGSPEQPLNNSKGCGGVMRVAPVGMLKESLGAPPGDTANAFELAVNLAALTHGHPSGYLSAGVLGQIVAEIVEGQGLEAAIQHSLVTLARWPGHEETARAVQRAMETAANPSLPKTPETVETLGGGWVGEEALAISLYCALVYPEDFSRGVLLAVNHSGDSDSTGAICGNLLGLLLGRDAIPSPWLERIELREEIERIALEFLQ